MSAVRSSPLHVACFVLPDIQGSWPQKMSGHAAIAAFAKRARMCVKEACDFYDGKEHARIGLGRKMSDSGSNADAERAVQVAMAQRPTGRHLPGAMVRTKVCFLTV